MNQEITLLIRENIQGHIFETPDLLEEGIIDKLPELIRKKVTDITKKSKGTLYGYGGGVATTALIGTLAAAGIVSPAFVLIPFGAAGGAIGTIVDRLIKGGSDKPAVNKTERVIEKLADITKKRDSAFLELSKSIETQIISTGEVKNLTNEQTRLAKKLIKSAQADFNEKRITKKEYKAILGVAALAAAGKMTYITK